MALQYSTRAISVDLVDLQIKYDQCGPWSLNSETTPLYVTVHA